MLCTKFVNFHCCLPVILGSSGSFAQFFVRITALLSNITNVNDEDYRLAVLEGKVILKPDYACKLLTK